MQPRLWRSTDGGEHWSLVYPSPSSVKGVKMNSDHADEIILADPDPLGSIAAMAVIPPTSKILYAAAGTEGEVRRFLSRAISERPGKSKWICLKSPTPHVGGPALGGGFANLFLARRESL